MSKHDQWQVSAEAAEQYESVVARYIFEPWTPLIVDAVRVAEGERVLDVACGTGVVAYGGGTCGSRRSRGRYRSQSCNDPQGADGLTS